MCEETGELFFVENDGSLATCIPAEAIGDALEWANDGYGHYPVLTTMMHPRGRFYWPTRAKDAVEYCRLHIVCHENYVSLSYGTHRNGFYGSDTP